MKSQRLFNWGRMIRVSRKVDTWWDMKLECHPDVVVSRILRGSKLSCYEVSQSVYREIMVPK